MLMDWIRSNLRTYSITHQVPYIIAVWIPLHLIALVGMAYTAINLEWIYLLWFLPGWTIFGGLGAAVMLHRYTAHRSIEVRPVLRPLLLWISCMSGQGSPIWWAALHRGYHHAHSDKEKDIHSPVHGFWHAYMGWMFAITSESVSLRHAVDLLKDQQMKWFHKNYNKVIWSSLIILTVIDPLFAVWFYVVPALVSLHTDSLVNSLCHTQGSGYRRFNTKDHSENIWLLGILGWGQGWHNNHHSNPRIYDFGTTVSGDRREIDPCLLWIPIISPWSETKKLFKQRRTAWDG